MAGRSDSLYLGGFVALVVGATITVAVLSVDELDSPRKQFELLTAPQAPPAPPAPPPLPGVPPPSPNAPPSPPAGRRLEMLATAMRQPPSVVWSGATSL